MMQRKISWLIALTVAGFVLAEPVAYAGGNPIKGASVYRACAACHSIEPGRHMTGPSLAGIWGRKAGTVEKFARYSPALKAAGIVWNEETLDAWLSDPRKLVPGTSMSFRGMNDGRARGDLIAFLKNPAAVAQTGEGGRAIRPPKMPNLKSLSPPRHVTAVVYCRDTYRVITADGVEHPFWEFNLRFKTDSSDDGPTKGNPALLSAGMGGDRASVIFADPSEMGTFIEKKC